MNIVSVIILVSSYTLTSNAIDAKVYARCDNYGTYYVSRDGGLSYNQVLYEGAWTNLVDFKILDITGNTVLKVECEDVGVVGGFISTIDYDGQSYYTTNPIEDCNFEINEFVDTFVYTEKSASPWHRNDNEINDNAYWIWNDKIYNTLTFTFDFGNIQDEINTGWTSSSTTNAPLNSDDYVVEDTEDSYDVEDTEDGYDVEDTEDAHDVEDTEDAYVVEDTEDYFVVDDEYIVYDFEDDTHDSEWYNCDDCNGISWWDSNQNDDDGKRKGMNEDLIWIIPSICVVIFVVIVMAAIIYCLRFRKSSNREQILDDIVNEDEEINVGIDRVENVNYSKKQAYIKLGKEGLGMTPL